ncbi:MAG: PD40 domain-containing protein, partial [Anaerolineae bacterium]|nr:PD40 domain-containing protein [Anaerolineae bacterium]
GEKLNMLRKKAILFALVFVLALAFAPGLLPVTAQDDAIRVIPVTGEVVLGELSPDGRTLALYEIGVMHGYEIIADYLPLRLVDIESGTVTELTGPTDYVQDVAFSPDGAILASVQANGYIYLWDTASGTEIKRIPATRTIGQIEFAPDGRTLITRSGGLEPVLLVWDTDTSVITSMLIERYPTLNETLTITVERTNYTYIEMDIAPDGSALVLVTSYDGILLWNLADELPVTLRAGLDQPRPSIVSLAYAPGGETLIFSDRDDMLHVWDITSASDVQTVPLVSELIAGQPAWTPDGSRIAWIDAREQALVVLDLAQPDEPQIIRLPMSDYGLRGGRSYPTLALTPDGRQVVFFGYVAGDTGGENVILVFDVGG